jgi:UDP-N-acetylglucosamine 2-epimerase
VAEVLRLLDDNPLERLAMARRAFPFGDGRAGPRIAEIIKQRLDVRRDLGPSRDQRRSDVK